MNTTLLGFFRHQFVASPLKRLLWMVPLIAVMAFGPFVVDSALSAAFLPSMVTVLVLVALQQEETAYTALAWRWRRGPTGLGCSARSLRWSLAC